MRQVIKCENSLTASGAVSGGSVRGVGLTIHWQDGPLGRDGDRVEPNGAFVEGVIEAALQRLRAFEETKFACAENRHAIYHLGESMRALGRRTTSREVVGVEGTHGTRTSEG